MNNTELSTLIEIAEQCPYYGGRAVIDARGLVALAGAQATYHDEDCFVELRESKVGAQKAQNNEVRFLFENPASNRITYKILGSKEKSCDVSIRNLSGQIAKSFKGINLNGSLPTNELAVGLNIIECRIGNQKLIDKLIIQH